MREKTRYQATVMTSRFCLSLTRWILSPSLRWHITEVTVHLDTCFSPTTTYHAIISERSFLWRKVKQIYFELETVKDKVESSIRNSFIFSQGFLQSDIWKYNRVFLIIQFTGNGNIGPIQPLSYTLCTHLCICCSYIYRYLPWRNCHLSINLI